ncbi:hypothetical protein P7H17_24010 [Paenibacillus larvae]|nr:hypothetical protein [Paenibacillus larvae]MDT2288498.1 hypothetical protein [Paenibacillus larvae]
MTCYLTWKASVTTRKQLLFRLVPSVLRTEGTESSFWGTPSASDVLWGVMGADKREVSSYRYSKLEKRPMGYTDRIRDYSEGKNRINRNRKTKMLERGAVTV